MPKRLFFGLTAALWLFLSGLFGIHPQSSFASQVNYSAPLPQVTIHAIRVVYQPQDNVYLLTFSVANPQLVNRLILSVEETDGGKIVVDDVEINLAGQESLRTDFQAQDLRDGKTYTIKIRATGFDNYYLVAPANSTSCSKDDPTTIGCHEFTHELPVEPGCDFSIQSVVSDYERRVFVFDLAMPALCGDVFYQGIIVEDETSQKVQDIRRSTFFASEGTNVLEISMPPKLLALKRNQPPPEYAITLSLETTQDKKTTQTFVFAPPAPKRPSLTAQLTAALRENPYLLVAIFMFGVALLAYRAYQNQRVQKEKEELRRPPVNRTQVLSQERPQMRLKLRVLATPGQPPAREAIIDRFPYIIGRTEGDFTLPNDPRMSGQHAKITTRGHEFYIEDLESKNHTFVVGEKLEPRQLVRLLNPARVRFGPDF